MCLNLCKKPDSASCYWQQICLVFCSCYELHVPCSVGVKRDWNQFHNGNTFDFYSVYYKAITQISISSQSKSSYQIILLLHLEKKVKLFYTTCKSNSKLALTVKPRLGFPLVFQKHEVYFIFLQTLCVGAYNLSFPLLVIPAHLKMFCWAESWCWKCVFSLGNFWNYRKGLWNIGNYERKKSFLTVYVCVPCKRNIFMIKRKYTAILSRHSQRQHGKEQVQRWAANMLRGLGYLFCKARLRAVAPHPEEENVLGRI